MRKRVFLSSFVLLAGLVVACVAPATPAPAREAVSTVAPASEAARSFITIDEPVEGATLNISEAVTVRGTGGALFEGNVVVRALDANGNVLAEATTIIDSPDAGIGGQGPWSVTLTISAEPGTTGEIVAFSPSPADGEGLMAEARVTITYTTGASKGGGEVELVGIVWQWQRFVGNDDTIIDVDAPEKYTLVFLPDGTVKIQADCNSVSGTYKLDGSSLTLELGPSTMAECPPGSLHDEYLARLSSVGGYVMKEGQLVLNLIADAGDMFFANGGPAQ